MKYKLSFCLFFFSIILIAQDKYSKEISFITDNDLYVSTMRDRYYTSGIFLSYKYLADNKNQNLEKKIIEWQIGHEMFTPNNASVTKIEDHDRPFAAYLYGSFGIKKIYKRNKIFNTTLQLGVIGPNAYGKELQSFIHQFYNFKETIGWKHQIKNAFGINLDLEYSSLISKSKSDVFDISWVNVSR